eukprot:scaffold68333_cov27-Phaeocystis_antarctica.AAC.1
MQQQGQQRQGQGQGQGQFGARAHGGCATAKGTGGTGGVAAVSSEEQKRLETFEGAMELYSVALNEL